jgi:hypothetical protein
MGGELEEDWVWERRRDDGRGVNGDGMSGGGVGSDSRPPRQQSA